MESFSSVNVPHTTGLINSQELELFFDGACPLCKREISLLKKLDRKGKIKFTDISSSNFNPSTYGMSIDSLMKEINARLSDGTWIKGVEVFRKLYELVGFKFIVKVSRWPVVSQLLDTGYRIFAKNRLRFTGRCLPESQSCEILKNDPSS